MELMCVNSKEVFLYKWFNKEGGLPSWLKKCVVWFHIRFIDNFTVKIFFELTARFLLITINLLWVCTDPQ